jgi:NSS family neurotransmitter:Na+ symporter
LSGLFVILIVLAIRAVTLPGAGAGLDFYLRPDFS